MELTEDSPPQANSDWWNVMGGGKPVRREKNEYIARPILLCWQDEFPLILFFCVPPPHPFESKPSINSLSW